MIHGILKNTPPLAHTYNPDVPVEISAVIRKCTEKKPDDRYQSVDEFIKDIRLFLNEGWTNAYKFYSIKEPKIKVDSSCQEKVDEIQIKKSKKRKIMYFITALCMAAFISFSFYYLNIRQKALSEKYCRKVLQDARNFARTGRPDIALSLIHI